MSATTTGTPAADSCSVSTCRVFVLPVPVAPAMSPCRLTIASGTRIRACGYDVPSSRTAPNSRAEPVDSYPLAIRSASARRAFVSALGVGGDDGVSVMDGLLRDDRW